MSFKDYENDPFFRQFRLVDWFVGRSVVFCSYSDENYRDELFDRFGIAKPDKLNQFVEERKAEFLAGRLCASNSLRQFREAGHNILIGSYRNPIWPSGYIGSISHTNGYAIAVVDTERNLFGLGIDIEKIISMETIAEIQEVIVNAREVELLTKLNISFAIAFSLIFSMKESFFKAVYHQVKCYFDFSAIEVCDFDTQNKQATFRLNLSLHPKLRRDIVYQAKYHLIDDQYIASLFALDIGRVVVD